MAYKKGEYVQKGDKKVSSEQFIANLDANYKVDGKNDWGSQHNLTSQEKANDIEILKDFKQGFLNGELSFKDNGIIVDSTGRRSSTNDPKDPKRRVAKYINDVFDKSTAYVDPDDKNKIKYDRSKGIATALNRLLFNNDSFNLDFLLQDTYDSNLGKRLHTNRAGQIITALANLNLNLDNTYLDLSDSDRNSLSLGIATLIDKLKDGELSDLDRMYMSNLGLNPDLYLYGKESWNEESPSDKLNSDESDPLIAAQKQMEELLKLDLTKLVLDAVAQKSIYDRYLALPQSIFRFNLSSADDVLKFNSFNSAMQNKLELLDIDGPVLQKFQQFLDTNDKLAKILQNKQLLNSSFDSNPFLGSKFSVKNKKTGESKSLFEGMTNKEVLSLLLGRLSNGEQGWNPITNLQGHPIIGNSNKEGYVLTFDPNSRSIYESRIADLPQQYIKTVAPQIGSFVDYMIQQIPSSKNGGTILKALFGAGTYLFVGQKPSEILKKERKEKEEAEAKADEAERIESGKTKELWERDKKKLSEGLTTTDYARIGSAMADLASLGMSASLFGSAFSWIPGVAGTIGSAAADIADGESFYKIAKNTAFGLGMDFVGSIPIIGSAGKLAKVGKVAQKIIKASPFILSIANNITDKNMKSSIGKVINGDFSDLTHEDGKNLLHFFLTLTGTARAGVGLVKSSRAKFVGDRDDASMKFVNTNKGKIKVGDGLGEISEAKYNEMQGKSLAEINAILQGIPGFSDAKIKSTRKIPFIKKEDVSKDAFIETDKYTWDLSHSNERLPWFLRSSEKDLKALEHNLNKKNTEFTWNIFNLLKGRRGKNSTTPDPISTTTPISTPKVFPDLSFRNLPSKTKVVDLRNYAGTDTTKQAKVQQFLHNYEDKRVSANGLSKYLTSKGITPNYTPSGAIYLRNKLFIFKNGGALNKAKELVNSFKSGGSVRKYDSGGGFDNILDAVTYNKDRLSKRLQHVLGLNREVLWIDRNTNANNDINSTNLQYDPEEGGNEVENTKRYQNWKNILTSRADIAEHWANEYLNRAAGNNMSKIAETYRNAWFKDGKFNFDNFKNFTLNNSNHVWDDMINGIGHDFYFGDVYLGDDGKYYNDLQNGYIEDGEAELDPNHYIYVHRMKKASETNPAEELRKKIFEGSENEPTEIIPDADLDPVKQNPLDFSYLRFQERLNDISQLGRMLDGLHTNKLSYDANVNAYISPNLLESKLYLSPTHGKYGILANSLNQAGQGYRMAENIQSTDPSLRAAAWLDMHRQNSQMLNLAKMQDDAMFNLTAQEAKLRDEKSMESRVDTANVNRLSIQHAREVLAQLQSDYLTKQYGIRSNYLIQNENNRNTKISDYKKAVLDLSSKISKLNYNAEIKAAKDAYERKVREMEANNDNSDIQNTQEYRNLVDAMERASVNLEQHNVDTINQLLGVPNFKFKNYTYNFKEPLI